MWRLYLSPEPFVVGLGLWLVLMLLDYVKLLWSRKKSESIPTFDEVNHFAQEAAIGAEFFKHSRLRRPSIRLVQIQGATLTWESRRRPEEGIDLRDVTEVVEGKALIGRLRRHGKLDDSCCFSIVTKEMTLHLQAGNPEDRRRWCEGIRILKGEFHMDSPLPDMLLSTTTVGDLHRLKRGSLLPKHIRNSPRTDYFTLYKFYRSHLGNRDPKLTAEAWERTYEWRTKNKVWDILSDPTDQALWKRLKRHLGSSFHGFDQLGRPVYIERSGAMDLDGILGGFTVPEFIRVHVYFMEKMAWRCREQSERSGKRVSRFVLVQDMKGIGLQHRKYIGMLRHLSALDKANYPGCVGAVYLINCPTVFSMLWALGKRFILETTRQKIHIYSDTGWKKALREVIDSDQLPPEYGGTCNSCPNGVCVPQATLGQEPSEPGLHALEQKVQDLQGKLEDSKTCCLCCDREKNTRLTCGHVLTCDTCAQELDCCPLCRAPVTSHSRVFLS